MVLTKSDVLASVREHLIKKGYKVTHSPDAYGKSIEITAEKEQEKFLIECVWENPDFPGTQSITYAIGKIVKRMKERGFWIFYGIAIPKSYFKLLGEYEVAGFEALDLHVMLVEDFYELKHLSPKMTIELLEGLKTGKVAELDIWGINYGL